MSLFQELKRRNVFRVSIAYLVVGWLVLQVADVILNNVEAPGWVFHVILLLLGIGLVLVVVFSWAFEMTPEGLKRESEVDRTHSITPQTGRKLDRLIIGVLVLALAYFAIDKFVLSGQPPGAVVPATPPETASVDEGRTDPQGASPVKSIAVLPFVNMSSDPEQEYFSDGLSEELLNLLAKIPDLKVASRSSSFQFKGEKIDLQEVAAKLNVAHVLEGSVRKSGNQLRITAQLIKADDGYHMWSETYDRSLDNIFAIQDEISAAVVDAMKIELLGEAPKAEVVNSEAYSLWLKGRFVYAKWGKENFESAIDAYRQAIAIEPTFAQAWASLSVAYLTQTNSGYLAREEGLILARDAIDRALVLQPELPEALARLAVIQAQFEWDWSGAISSVEKALQLDPENTIVLSAAGNVMSSVGRSKDALQHFESILTIEPLDLIGLYNTASQLNVLGRPEDAERTYRQLLELNPQDWGTHTQLALIMLQQGRLDEAWEELKLEVDPQQQEWGRLIALHVMGRAEEADQRLQAFTQEHASWAAPLIAQVYAWREEPDAAFEWLYRAREERDSNLPAMVWEPVFADMRLDPRWTELMAAMGLEE